MAHPLQQRFRRFGHQLYPCGYRYNSKGFYTLEDTMESYTRSDDWSAPQQRRARTEATIDQTLPEGWGSVTLSMVKRRTGVRART